MLFVQKAEKYIHQPTEQLKLGFGGEMTANDTKAIEEIINKDEQKPRKKKIPSQNHPNVWPVHLEVVETIIQPHGNPSATESMG